MISREIGGAAAGEANIAASLTFRRTSLTEAAGDAAGHRILADEIVEVVLHLGAPAMSQGIAFSERHGYDRSWTTASGPIFVLKQ
jgi:hypothetical protein